VKVIVAPIHYIAVPVVDCLGLYYTFSNPFIAW